ncbi:tetratricopeptide repeat protein [Hymenobacter baengnokdamensis]|uniref:tetratricopeptide repeat protein n=1 Tax=Hymenobacter baengnokdamensis TaxID=2615203 RepID=UPI001248BB9A|nr:tetratricopeptide repeat protein [Hymenobacter baengnokdamensis]
MSEHTTQPDRNPRASNLPATVSITATVLRRTQTQLDLLQEVVQESSAEYWYNKGENLFKSQKFSESIYCFERSYSLGDLFALEWLGKLYDARLAEDEDGWIEWCDEISQYSD